MKALTSSSEAGCFLTAAIDSAPTPQYGRFQSGAIGAPASMYFLKTGGCKTVSARSFDSKSWATCAKSLRKSFTWGFSCATFAQTLSGFFVNVVPERRAIVCNSMIPLPHSIGGSATLPLYFGSKSTFQLFGGELKIFVL